MLTSIRIQNFKQFRDVTIELGQTVALIGPNNSGKTSVLQALALWYTGMQIWYENVAASVHLNTEIQPAPVINRINLVSTPVPQTQLLWRNLKTRNSKDVEIDITATLVQQSEQKSYSLKFQYANEESISIELGNSEAVPPEPGRGIPRFAFLSPLSGLAAIEPRLEQGRINVLIGEGRTAEILRNLCYHLSTDAIHGIKQDWHGLTGSIQKMFGVEIMRPEYLPGRGEIRMAYRDANGIVLDISAAGRGMLQILLLLAYLYDNPGTVLLLDEPDAHLEILRQREIYQLLTDITRQQNSQLIIASHSEVVLNEAADRDIVVAMVGEPRRIDSREKRQVEKSLKEIGFDQYYQVLQTGWVLYLEGSSDLAVLRAFAEKLEMHEVNELLERPFVHYVSNRPSSVRYHFQALKVAHEDTRAFVLFDRLQKPLPPDEFGDNSIAMMWQRNEIENYFAFPPTLLAYARTEYGDEGEAIMRDLIEDNLPPAAIRDTGHIYWLNTAISKDFLDLLFHHFFQRLSLPNIMRKKNYHVLVQYTPVELLDDEVREKLNQLLKSAAAD